MIKNVMEDKLKAINNNEEEEADHTRCFTFYKKKTEEAPAFG